MRLRDLATGQYTEGHEFDGDDTNGELRAALRAKPSVSDTDEIVVGSFRMYLSQQVKNPHVEDQVDTEMEIVQRTDWLIWSDEDERWVIYPPKLKAKYFASAPQEDADGAR